MTGPLEGYRVLDLADEKGAACAKMLADLGADVVKVEPFEGDATRRVPPFVGDSPHPEGSLQFAYYNTNKRAITLDLESPEGQDALRLLIQRFDVVIESFIPGTLARLGLDYERLSKENPGIILTSITGFGQFGPYAHYQAPDIVCFAMGGPLYVSGDPDGRPCTAPGNLAYGVAGAWAAAGTIIALYHRATSNQGQHVDVSGQEAAAMITDSALSRFFYEGVGLKREGNSYLRVTPGNLYPCKDGWVRIVSGQPVHWHRLIAWLDNPKPLDDPSWVARDQRNRNREFVDAKIGEYTSRYTRAELFQSGQRVGVPITPVNTPRDYLGSEFAKAREFFKDVEHPHLGRQPYAMPPFKFSETPVQPPAPAPSLGQHNVDIYGGELGLSEEERARLTRRQGKKGGQEPVGRVPDPWSPPDSLPSSATLPLAGIRVIEFTTGIVGPALGRLLAEFGAESIKVESHKRPDFSRGPKLTQGISFADNSRSKKSVSIDVSRPEGRKIVEDLVKISDVIVDNFSAGVMQKLGFDYPKVRSMNASVVMISMQGLGATEAHSVTFGQNIAPIVGLTYQWNHPGAQKPVSTQLFYPDYYAGAPGACAVLAALDHRRRTGQGQYIDSAQAECAASLLGPYYLDCAANDRVAEPLGNGSLVAAPHGCYRCAGADAWCVIVVSSDEEWQAFRAVVGNPDWSQDKRFEHARGRVEHRSELDARVEAWTLGQDAYAVMEQLQAVGVGAGVAQDIRQVSEDPHLAARKFFVEVDQPEMGRLRHAGIPMKHSATPGTVRSHAPLLGEHNDYVLRELLGMEPEEIQRLEEVEVIY